MSYNATGFMLKVLKDNLAQNAHRFGFVIRYQPGQDSVTGYSAEPWHLRYVGPKDAAGMVSRGVKALETYYGLPAAPDYR